MNFQKSMHETNTSKLFSKYNHMNFENNILKIQHYFRYYRWLKTNFAKLNNEISNIALAIAPKYRIS